MKERISTEKRPKWFFKGQSIVLGFILFGPFILPLVWFHPTYSPQKKIVVTGIILLLTYLLFVLTKDLLTQYFQIYDQMLNGMY